jgi:type II secretory pathway component PulF
MIDDLKTWFYRAVLFRGDTRAEFYSILAMYIRTGVPPLKACDTIYSIQSNDGLSPRGVLAVVAQECAVGIEDGIALHETLERWSPYDESSTIRAGAVVGTTSEKGNSLANALDRASEIIEQKGKMTSAIVTAAIYPLTLISAAFGLSFFLADYLIPQVTRLERSQGQQHELSFGEIFANVVSHDGIFIATFCVVSVIAVWFSMASLTGRTRLMLERIPPWSLYKTVQGGVFFYNIGVLMQGTIPILKMLEIMQANAKPYMRERLASAINGIEMGKSLGEALRDAPHQFPSREGIAFLQSVGNLEGGDEKLTILGQQWMTRAIRRVEIGAQMLNYAAYGLGGIVALVFGTVLNDMVNNILKGFNIL